VDTGDYNSGAITEEKEMGYIQDAMNRITQNIASDTAYLRKQIAAWQSEHLPGMRGYRRNEVRKTISYIRAARANLKAWEVQQ
jgi:hypothetical protein